jgi:hypothetical protein
MRKEKGWQPEMDKWVTSVRFDFDVAYVGAVARRQRVMPNCN